MRHAFVADRVATSLYPPIPARPMPSAIVAAIAKELDLLYVSKTDRSPGSNIIQKRYCYLFVTSSSWQPGASLIARPAGTARASVVIPDSSGPAAKIVIPGKAKPSRANIEPMHVGDWCSVLALALRAVTVL